MEPVAPDPFFMEVARQGVIVGERTVAAVKCRVETGDLRQCGEAGKQRANGSEIVRLMQRRQRHVTLQPRQHVVVDANGPVVFRPAMHHPVTHRHRIDATLLAQPRPRRAQSRRDVGDGSGLIGLVDQHTAVGGSGPQPRAAADAVDLAPDLALRIAAVLDREDLELDARRAGIDDEDGIHGAHTAGTAAARRRASA